MTHVEHMSREELIEALRATQAAAAPQADLVHELQVHQIELEMQNRELRDAQQMLEESRARYADLFDFAPVGYCTLDARGRVLEINLTGAAMVGVDRARLLGSVLAFSLDREGGRRLRAHLQRCVVGERRVVTDELTLAPAQGARLAVQVTSVPHSLEGETVYRTVLADVTAQQRTRAALRWLCDAGARLGALLDEGAVLASLPSLAVPALADRIAVYLAGEAGPHRVAFDADDAGLSEGAIDDFPALRAALRVALARGVGQLVVEPSPPARHGVTTRGRSALVCPLALQGRVLGAVALVGAAPRATYTDDERLLGEEFGARVALALEHARLYRAAHAATTLAERERARAEAANRAKDDFLAAVSHELRTPLSAILGWVQVLQRGGGDDDRSARALATIERNAHAQVRLIGDLLDVARIQAGKVGLVRAAVALSREVEAAVEAARPAAVAKGVTLSTRIDDEGITVDGDAERLQQVASNQLHNALKFTPPGGSVMVSLRRAGAQVELAVRDTGVGIEREMVPRVFERFWQAEGGPGRSHGGLGLGLAIVQQLVEAHGGSVAAESEGLGRGATFRVLLPCGERLRDATPTPTARGAAWRDLRALVVEDDEDTREMLAQLLEESGVQVTTASTVPEALERFERTHPHVVISDIGLPGEDGCALVRRIRSMPPEAGGATPAVAVTAHVRDEDRDRVLGAGFTAFLQKPVAADDLFAVLHSLAPS